jgi:WhiB family transcriptional regulator, redox-sensing transcriptional regulator
MRAVGLVTGRSEPSQAGHVGAAGTPAGSRGAACSSVALCDWMSRGACLGEDPELFFPIAATGSALRQISAAKRVCQRCTVRASCLTYALETRQSGIWGGTTTEERFAMREPSRWHSGGQASRPARPRVAEHAEPATGLTPDGRLVLIRNPSVQ